MSIVLLNFQHPVPFWGRHVQREIWGHIEVLGLCPPVAEVYVEVYGWLDKRFKVKEKKEPIRISFEDWNEKLEGSFQEIFPIRPDHSLFTA